ncbi:MAG: hypothetical protein WC052_04370 [Patescibacteria group bacterium]
MSTTGPGIDPFGPLYLGTSRATSVHIGENNAILVDNTPMTGPTVSISGNLVRAPVIAEYWSVGTSTTITTGAKVPFASTGYSVGGIVKTGNVTFTLPGAGVYRVQWRLTGASATGAAGIQCSLYLESGALAAPDNGVAATSPITRTATGSNTTGTTGGSEIMGVAILVVTAGTPAISLVNSGASTINVAAQVNTVDYTYAGLVIQRIA